MATAKGREGPWGGAVLKGVVSKVVKGWPPGLTVLTGDDAYHLDRAQAAILKHLVPDGMGSLGVSVFGDEPISTQGLVGAARSAGMFSSRRVVFLRDVAALEGEPEPLAAFAASPGADSFIVVRALKLDRKRRLHKALAEAGTCLVFRPPAQAPAFKELASEVKGMAAASGVALDERALGLLIAASGSDLNRIAAEIEKLSVWQGAERGEGRGMDAATLRGLIAGSAQMSGWELADAVTERDLSGAIAAARRLVDQGQEPIRIVGGVASRIRALLAAKAMADAGAPAQGVVDAARAWYFRDALATGLERYALAELLAMPRKLLEADRSFKSRSLDKGAVLEALVLGLTR